MNTNTKSETTTSKPLTLPEIRDRATLTVVEAGKVLSLGRDASYRAAKAGQIPTIQVGRRLVVPAQRFLALLGAV